MPSTARSTTRPAQGHPDRAAIADAILARLDEATLAEAARHYAATAPSSWFMVDDLLPPQLAHAIHAAFPAPAAMFERRSLREHKYIAAQMDRYHPLAEEAIFAFQDERVVGRIAEVTRLAGLQPDDKLYAGGISLMARGNFLNPHLDNSHNNDRSLYRVLNLLYYVSPQWDLSSGGHLELWPLGMRHPQQTIPSLFNRLVVMATGPQSWHSVSRVERDEPRCCVSNYYFSEQPVGGQPYFRVTQFRGRPEQPLRDLVLRLDAGLRQGLRLLRPQGLVATKHIYRRPGQEGR